MDDRSAWDTVLENERLVRKVVDRFTTSKRLSFDDWYSAGMISAHQAVLTYDPSRARLSTWMWTVTYHGLFQAWRAEELKPKGANSQGGRDFSQRIFLGRAEDAGTTVRVLNRPDDDFVDRLLDKVDAETSIPSIEAFLEPLDPVDREVLLLRVWGEMTLQEISEQLGFTKSRAGQRLRRALDTLAEQVAA